MKRSPMKPSRKPMQRSAMQRGGSMKRDDFLRPNFEQPWDRKPSKLPPELRAPKGGRPTPDEKDYMARVAAFGCVLCQLVFGLFGIPAHVHHLKDGGGSKRASHFDTMPLCPEHHIGNTGIHMLGQERFAQMYGITERALLDYFKQKLGVAHG